MRRRRAATKAHQTRKPLVHARSLGSSCHQRGQSAKITRALQNKQLRLWTPLWPQGRTLGPARPAIERRKQLQPHTARGHKMQNSNMAAPAFRRVLRKRAYPKSQTKRGNHSCKRALFGEGSPSSSLCRRNSLYTQLPSSKYETQPLSRIGNARSTLLSQWLELATPAGLSAWAQGRHISALSQGSDCHISPCCCNATPGAHTLPNLPSSKDTGSWR